MKRLLLLIFFGIMILGNSFHVVEAEMKELIKLDTTKESIDISRISPIEQSYVFFKDENYVYYGNHFKNITSVNPVYAEILYENKRYDFIRDNEYIYGCNKDGPRDLLFCPELIEYDLGTEYTYQYLEKVIEKKKDNIQLDKKRSQFLNNPSGYIIKQKKQILYSICYYLIFIFSYIFSTRLILKGKKIYKAKLISLLSISLIIYVLILFLPVIPITGLNYLILSILFVLFTIIFTTKIAVDTVLNKQLWKIGCLTIILSGMLIFLFIIYIYLSTYQSH